MLSLDIHFHIFPSAKGLSLCSLFFLTTSLLEPDTVWYTSNFDPFAYVYPMEKVIIIG